MDSVARLGVYGKKLEKLWCTTSTECIHLWDWQAACSEEAAGQTALAVMLLLLLLLKSVLYRISVSGLQLHDPLEVSD